MKWLHNFALVNVREYIFAEISNIHESKLHKKFQAVIYTVGGRLPA